MAPANDNQLAADPFAHLPLFATDKEIAVALVGKARAAQWLRERMPTVSGRSGFPAVDQTHGGRPVPLVKIFYDRYLGLGDTIVKRPNGVERVGEWNGSKRRA